MTCRPSISDIRFWLGEHPDDRNWELCDAFWKPLGAPRDTGAWPEWPWLMLGEPEKATLFLRHSSGLRVIVEEPLGAGCDWVTWFKWIRRRQAPSVGERTLVYLQYLRSVRWLGPEED